MSEAYVQQINEIFDTHQVDEVDYMMNTEGPFVLFAENNLGISAVIAKPLYKHALHEFCALNERLVKCELSVTDEIYKINALSRILLIIKGDLPLAFKYRKIIIQFDLQSVNKEICFLNMLFSKHPKSPSGWFHRRWCLELNRRRSNRIDYSYSEVETERELCRKMCEKYPKNYYAWTHRQWLLRFMSDVQLDEELNFTKEWLLSHISDHSASNHRVQVVLQIISRGTDHFRWRAAQEGVTESVSNNSSSSNMHISVLSFLHGLMTESQELLLLRPGHEALWYHRRSMFGVVLSVVRALRSRTSCDRSIDSTRFTDNASSEVAGWGMILIDQNLLSSPVVDATSTDSSVAFSDQYASMSNRVLSLLQRCGAVDSCESDILEWLALQLRFESALCRWCASVKDGIWDDKTQRLLATRFCAFVFDVVLDRRSQVDSHGQQQIVSGLLKGHVVEGTSSQLTLTQEPFGLSHWFRENCAEVLLKLCAELLEIDAFSQIWQSKIRQYLK